MTATSTTAIVGLPPAENISIIIDQQQDNYML
jgi:hypothetical protein